MNALLAVVVAFVSMVCVERSEPRATFDERFYFDVPHIKMPPKRFYTGRHYA